MCAVYVVGLTCSAILNRIFESADVNINQITLTIGYLQRCVYINETMVTFYHAAEQRPMITLNCMNH